MCSPWELKHLACHWVSFIYTIVDKVRRQDVQPVLHNAFVSQDPVRQKLLEVEKQVLIT
jgi:hypothetical protein